jgi:hypothetical protein
MVLVETFWRGASSLNWNTLSEERSTSMKCINKRISNAMVAACILCSTGVARADVVTQWNEYMQAAVIAAPSNPNLQTRWGAIVQLAVFEAVNSITGDYVPYLGTIVAPPGASPEAATIAAAHRTLVTLRSALPAVVADLDTKRVNALAAIPDSQAKTDGIAVGEAAAAAMLALRENDGWNAPVTYIPGDGPGVWRPVSESQIPLLPGWGQVTPFGIESGSQFRLQAPPQLQTEKYANDVNEVKLLGRIDSAFRPQDRTDVARFYALSSPVAVWNSSARQVSAVQGKTLSENARDFAVLAMAMADAGIAMWDTKYAYNFWRPQAAIRLADTDDNPLTDPDPTWLPLIATPAHPSYASGHASVSGSAKAVMEEIYGKDGHAVTLVNPAVPGNVVLNYSSWDEITEDIDDARIYGGIHFRFDQEKGAHLGKQVGKYIYQNHLRPAK